MKYWLMKSEPDVYPWSKLVADGRGTWDGVRNHTAKLNLMAMKVGDRAFFYHSSCDPPAVVGVVEIVREAYPDSSAWNPDDDHFDPKASPENPVWSMVDVKLVEVFPRPVPLGELRSVKALADLELLRRGSRLSVHPVTAAEFRTIQQLGCG